MSTEPDDTARAEPPPPPPTPPPPAGAPPAPPLAVPVPQPRGAARGPAPGDPCAALTTAALQAVIDKIGESRDKAVADAAAHGAAGGPGYPSAAVDNLAYVTQAHDGMRALRDWLQAAGVLDPPPFVTNLSGAYHVHSYVREAVVALHYARHWATISVVYHSSVDAGDSYELTTQALELIEPLGAQAGRCYIAAYYP